MRAMHPLEIPEVCLNERSADRNVWKVDENTELESTQHCTIQSEGTIGGRQDVNSVGFVCKGSLKGNHHSCDLLGSVLIRNGVTCRENAVEFVYKSK